MTSQPETQKIVIQVLPNISRSKGNQTMKFHQLCNIKRETLSLKKYTQNVEEKLFQTFF